MGLFTVRAARHLVIATLAMTASHALAQTEPGETASTETAQPDTGELIRQLQEQLRRQQDLIEQQQKDLAKQETRILNQQQQLSTQTDVLTNLQSQIDQLSEKQSPELSADELAMRQRLEKLESQVGKIPSDPATMLADQDFPGAIRVPGTTAAYKIGGYVKAALVKNFNPLISQDRFIPGSIPITPNDQTAVASEARLTAQQSRVNFDYRQKAEGGTVRAFVEGDFAGGGTTFRLRHAFGQYQSLLAGKTWSAFYDADAAPEEVDFEGINGRVLVRQTQVRFFPEIGKDWRWMLSLEDPQPKVTGGIGVSDVPDIVSSIRREWFKRWHVKTALLLRQIRAINNSGVDFNGQPCTPVGGTLPGQPDANSCVAIANAGNKEREYGWALTASGKVAFPLWGERDKILFQFNYGEGLGRYLTDLASVQELGIDGGQDAVVDPLTGNMKTLPVFGGYLAYEHWWGRTVRSTFVYSVVDVNNVSFQPNSAYKQTQRISGNFIWSPTASVDLGAEFLLGKRTNKGPDPDNGKRRNTATQLQIEAVYRF